MKRQGMLMNDKNVEEYEWIDRQKERKMKEWTEKFYKEKAHPQLLLSQKLNIVYFTWF